MLQLKLLIAKLKHNKFGASSERGRKLIDQLELQLDELVTAASEAAAAAEKAAPKDPATDRLASPARRPVRAALPAHLPRERVVVPAPSACPCCGGRLSKLGEDVTETLEVIPRQWKVVQTVRAWAAKRTKVQLPRLRDHHPAAGAVSPDHPRPRRAASAGHDHGGEVRPAPAAEPYPSGE